MQKKEKGNVKQNHSYQFLL